MKNKRSNTRRNKKGFTMVELLFAVANFAFIMMIAISAFIAVMQVYNKANFARQTQQTARTIVDQFTRDSQYASSVFIGSVGYVCNITTPGIAVDCICYLKPDGGMVAYYTAYRQSSGAPTITPASPDDEIKLWRAEVDTATVSVLSSSAAGCQDVVTDSGSGLIANWNSGGISTSNLIPNNMRTNRFIVVPDTNTQITRWSVLVLGLSKGTSSVASDPFFDNFEIQTITAIRKDI